jgi:hypothetical protein
LKSQLTHEFVEHFRKLPKEVQNTARRSYQIWRDNPAHPGLQFKRIQNQDDVYSVRVGIGWRALGLLEGGTISWFWIGSHAEYDKLTK